MLAPMRATEAGRAAMIFGVLAVSLHAGCSSKSTAHGTASDDGGPGKSGAQGASGADQDGSRADSSSGGAAGAGGASGGSDGGGTAGSGGGPAGVDCEALAEVQCNRQAACSSFSVDAGWGGVASCKARLALYCKISLSAPGSDPMSGVSCAAKLSSMSCQDLYADDVTLCDIRGTRSDGSACMFDRQCSSGICSRAGTSSCGVCAQPVGQNGECLPDGRCAAGLGCNRARRCVPAGSRGSPCDVQTAPCSALLSCISGTCGDPLPLGSSCDSADQNCNSTAGQICFSLGGNAVCRQKVIVTSGQCGLVGTELRQCRGDYTCNASYICQRRPVEGEACDPAIPGLCMWPAECKSGVCRAPDPAACG